MILRIARLNRLPKQPRFINSFCSFEPKLPAILWKPEDEFPSKTKWEPFRSNNYIRFNRLLSIVQKKTFDRRTLVLFTSALSAVYCAGSYEAYLLMNPSYIVSSSTFETLRFMHSYAMEQMLISCVWGTKSANLVAISLGLDAETVLRPLMDAASVSTEFLGQEADMSYAASDNAKAILQAQGFGAARSVMASAVALSQAIRTLAAALRAGELYETAVAAGREPLFEHDVVQRVIRLCGKESDVTSLSMQRYGRHIIPVLERNLGKEL